MLFARMPIGIKIFGADLMGIQKIGGHLKAILKQLPETRSVFAERVVVGYFVDLNLERDQPARYSLSVASDVRYLRRESNSDHRMPRPLVSGETRAALYGMPATSFPPAGSPPCAAAATPVLPGGVVQCKATGRHK
jgi:hypothetical protein